MSQSWSDLLMNDHQTTEKVFDAVDCTLASPDGPSRAVLGDAMKYFEGYVEGCHNKKEENHLFPLIERRGIPRSGGPLAVMLAEHEQSRALLPELVRLATSYLAGDRRARRTAGGVRPVLVAAQEPLLEGDRHPVPDGPPRSYRRPTRPRSWPASRRPRPRSGRTRGRSTDALAERIINAGGVEDLSFAARTGRAGAPS